MNIREQKELMEAAAVAGVCLSGADALVQENDVAFLSKQWYFRQAVKTGNYKKIPAKCQNFSSGRIIKSI